MRFVHDVELVPQQFDIPKLLRLGLHCGASTFGNKDLQGEFLSFYA